LEFSTYLGGSGSQGDNARGIAVDSARNIYVAGDASSADFPTMAPFQSTKATTVPFVAFATKISGALADNAGAGGGTGESATVAGGKGGGGTIGWDLIGVFAAVLAVRRQRPVLTQTNGTAQGDRRHRGAVMRSHFLAST